MCEVVGSAIGYKSLNTEIYWYIIENWDCIESNNEIYRNTKNVFSPADLVLSVLEFVI